MLLSLAAQYNLKLKQIDFKTAFLNAGLVHEIYVEQPEGYIQDKNLVCKLNKALYGLKQAPNEWYKELNQYLLSLGYKSTDIDDCLYTKTTENNRRIWLSLYVDDTIIAYDELDEKIWLQDKDQL
ncbi:MAG: reverse transcriptase domain-containing protein, partial [Nitrososphaeraceae archaeon]